MDTTEEAREQHHHLAARQGGVLREALDEMLNHVAAYGNLTEAGDYLVAIAIDEAEGMWLPNGDGTIHWHEPEEEEANAHLEIAVLDKDTGRFVPGLKVEATILGPDEKVIGTKEQPFVWHPWLCHYGRNWKLPGDGPFEVHVLIHPAPFPRYDKEHGNQFTEIAEVEFGEVELKRQQPA
jgi:hypothetical protein